MRDQGYSDGVQNRKGISVKGVIGLVLSTALLSTIVVGYIFLKYMPRTADAVTSTVASRLIDDAKSAPKMDVSYVNSKFREMGELTTAEMTYDGLLRYDQGNIPLLTQHGFLMSYSAHARAGIDFSQVRVWLEGETVVVSVPEAMIQVMYVDNDSIAIYDESHALFEGDGKDHLKTALVNAEADAAENLDTGMLLDKAGAQAEKLVKDLVSQFAYGAEIRVERR